MASRRDLQVKPLCLSGPVLCHDGVIAKLRRDMTHAQSKSRAFDLGFKETIPTLNLNLSALDLLQTASGEPQ